MKLEEAKDLYDRLVAANPKVERKGATVPYTAVNGNMFSYLSKQGKLELRLPERERGAFLKKHKAKLCDAYGVVQPQYVEVPNELLVNIKELQEYFTISHQYAKSLKPKPTKRGT